MKQLFSILLAAVLSLVATSNVSAKKDSLDVILRAGYILGGTTPLPLPAEIRSIDGFSPRYGLSVGVDVRRHFSELFGMTAGLHFFHEGFHTEATVKNYRMALTMEGNTMAGYFTGANVTNTELMGLTIPFMATLRLGNHWNVSAGPYVSLYFSKKFYGYVFDNSEGIGYLRVDTPTGDKINIDSSNPASYDFNDHMEMWSFGAELLFDWHTGRHWGAFGKVDWGLSNIFENEFDAVAFKMYPIYATFGVSYRL